MNWFWTHICSNLLVFLAYKSVHTKTSIIRSRQITKPVDLGLTCHPSQPPTSCDVQVQDVEKENFLARVEWLSATICLNNTCTDSQRYHMYQKFSPFSPHARSGRKFLFTNFFSSENFVYSTVAVIKKLVIGQYYHMASNDACTTAAHVLSTVYIVLFGPTGVAAVQEVKHVHV